MIMNISIPRTTCLMLALALLASPAAMAAKVFQWTDEEGVMHFSDTPPQNDASSDISEFELANYDGENADSDKYSIVNQLEQMTAWRRQTEEDQRALKKLQLEEERLALEERQSTQSVSDSNTNTYYPQVSYYPYPVYFPAYKPWHGRHPPRLNSHFSGSVNMHHGKLWLTGRTKITD